MKKSYKRVIKNQIFPCERDLYGATDVRLVNCKFDGAEDGESALKEARSVALDGCYMNLRYPLWHDVGVEMENVEMTENCRAALWYSEDVTVNKSKLLGIKALRECKHINIDASIINSPEFGWKSHFVHIVDSDITSEYIFFGASNVRLDNVRFKGKYSFQYVENVTIENCVLDTKDAFWHAKNVTVKNSIIKGEYLAWYSQSLTLIDCTIIGTQPLCYCEKLKLVNCKMQDTDLAFEYCDVEATVAGDIISVKNPRSGMIIADGIGEIIYTDDSKYPCNCKVIELNKLEVWSFGNNAQMADELFGLVLSGLKTATSCLLDGNDLESDDCPYSILTNGDCSERLLIKTTSKQIMRFNDVTEGHAFKEGEGDRSLDFWRDCHARFFSEELKMGGKSFFEDIQIVCEEFEVVAKL